MATHSIARAVFVGCHFTLDEFRGSKVLPVFVWEVMEGTEFVMVRDQLGDRPLVYDAIGVSEEIKGSMGLPIRFRQPGNLQFGPRFLAVGLGRQSQITGDQRLVNGLCKIWCHILMKPAYDEMRLLHSDMGQFTAHTRFHLGEAGVSQRVKPSAKLPNGVFDGNACKTGAGLAK